MVVGMQTSETGNYGSGYIVPKSSAALVSLFAEDDGSKTCFRIGFKEDELVVLLLNGAVTLINTCTIEQLEKVPWRFRKSLLLFLKKLWQDVHKQMLLGTILQLNQGRQFCVSNIGTNNLAESIFRLSINAGQPTVRYNIEKVRRSFFCPGEVSFEHFLLNHWEMSPLLIRSPLKAISTQDDIFTSFVQLFRSKEAVPSVLSLMLQNFTSALPISSDELDVLNFLKEVRDLLGCPMIYQQDIRVMKTQKREMHFFQKPLDSCFFEAPHFLYVDDILRCEEAYKEGYTMALRGIEFRLESVAAIADGLASLFGQPSAGANLYLTPPNSQGLACHFDDHCVLVCQLFGAKQWTIFPPSNLRLPRLYETSDSMHDLEGGSMIVDGCKQFWLKEGDVLYIPRGFPHEACTSFDNDGSSGNAGFSLHLTLAIEVEPPFE
ncbi:hypothetical protein RJ639_015615 [Escallonia herrerae]|uniref:Bifunctional lysine-specific demethylase and histidyl-hydroxylase n=1 Tax=Escallonia herrerae TaxID=1293975 RepID=A0AA89ALL8_9ASTE|nr:hypothetical protein RJ639_015615 [Escallonia herrerae]